MVLLGDEAQVDARFILRDSANLDTRWVHGLCETYHGLRIVLNARDGTPR
jgi:hypothetical protein